MKIKLREMIECLEMQFDEINHYVCLKTGEIVSITVDELRVAEEVDEEEIEKLQDWQQDNIRLAIDILGNFEDYTALPTKFDINEYEIMEDFIYSITDKRKQERLLNVIRGRGAFRRFKDKIDDFGISEEWYRYREECYRQIAIEWCGNNDLAFVE